MLKVESNECRYNLLMSAVYNDENLSQRSFNDIVLHEYPEKWTSWPEKKELL
jgi:hypothetical protein